MPQAAANAPNYRSAINIIAWNFIPYIGVIAYNWDPIVIFTCYALETLIIGVFNIFKLLFVSIYGLPATTEDANEVIADMGIMTIPVFATTYGFLAYVQLCMFLAFAGYVRSDEVVNSLGYSLLMVFGRKGLVFIMGMITCSHFYSFFNDFIQNKQYAHVTLKQQMEEPFPRIVISQFVVFFGLWVALALGSGIALLLLFSAIKTFIEIRFSNISGGGFMQFNNQSTQQG